MPAKPPAMPMMAIALEKLVIRLFPVIDDGATHRRHYDIVGDANV